MGIFVLFVPYIVKRYLGIGIMEYIFSAGNNKVILYSIGNNIYYSIVLGNKILQTKQVAKDYHIGLSCMQYKNDIFCAYITVARELVWQNVTTDQRLILFADGNELWNMEDLKAIDMDGCPTIFFQVKNPVTENVEIRYIFPEDNKKIKVLLADKSNVEKYVFFEGKEGMFLCCDLKENKDSRYFFLRREGNSDIDIKEHIFLEKEDFIALRNDMKKEKENYKIQLQKLEKDYENRLKVDLNYVERNYKKQYEELEKFTKDIQNEGKKWRELYYKSVKKR